MVNRPGDQLLASSRLARDEDRRVGRRDFADLAKDRTDRLRRSHDFLEHRGAADLFAKNDVLVLDSVFGPLAVVDVGACRVPPHDPLLFIPQRLVLYEAPAILAIVMECSDLQLERKTALEAALALFFEPVEILHVED